MRDRQLDRFVEAALVNGGASLDAPRARPEFGLYSAYVTGPDGNAVEVACPLDTAPDAASDRR